MTIVLIITIVCLSCIVFTWITHRNIFKAYEKTLTGFSHDTNRKLLEYQDAQAVQSSYLSGLLTFIATLMLNGAIRLEDQGQKHNIAHFLHQLGEAISDMNIESGHFYMITTSQAKFIQANPQVVPLILYRFFTAKEHPEIKPFCEAVIEEYKRERFLSFKRHPALAVFRSSGDRY